MSIDIDPLVESEGLRVTDHIENAQFELYTDRPVDPVPTDGENHYFPVDAAVRFSASTIAVPRVANVVVRDATGAVVAEGTDVEVPAGEYFVQVSPTPTKTYLHVRSGLTVVSGDERSRIAFDGETAVSAGFRSLNDQPAGTITTPSDPESMMRAVSLLGSSLATTSPERSFPTLRGHPPLIEVGDAFSVPDAVEETDSGVEIVVPPEYRYVFASASLAHYLDATVVPGSTPELRGDGWSHSLAPDFEARCSRVLRRTFYLDCLVRTEGFYPVELYELDRLDDVLDLEYARLYDLPLSERLDAYLDVPFEDLEPLLPQWSLTTDVRPAAENVSVLPYLADDLSLIRCPEADPSDADPESSHVSEFLRSPTDAPVVRGAADRGTGFTVDDGQFVQPDPVDTVEHAWVGEGIPIGANKATIEAYRRRIGRGTPERGSISVSVVCNDDRMREEGEVANLYGLRDMLQFDIEVIHDLTRAEMRELLASDVDFLHYIGHVDDRGMQCANGFLDLTDARLEIGVDSFLLNACQSYRQGQALIEGGSRGGIATLTDVANAPATELGRIVARLMNGGFNLRTALHVAQRALITGHQYSVLGDGDVTLCQSRSGAAAVFELAETGGTYDLGVRTYPIGGFGAGTLFTLTTDALEQHCLVPGKVTVRELTADQVERLLELEVFPVFADGELQWSDELLPL
ncbi:hypothetical protein GCM10027435_10140 [Haloparvum alkalitolerans]|uniref:caspase family protein n=1 Tax=Haloparvum alkalitolerans TaxID=1042953 RepID=UPI003CE72E29